MKVTEKDVKRLGVKAIECNLDSEVIALKGKLPLYHPKTVYFMAHRFQLITDKIIYWAELELDYSGG